MTGVTTDATDDAVQANIVAVGYASLPTPAPTPAPHCVEVGKSKCYRDSVHARIMGDPVLVSGDMTHEMCMHQCFSRQKRLAGVENGKQCMCGDVVTGKVPSANCTIACAGSSSESEFCGGWMAVSIINFTCAPS